MICKRLSINYFVLWKFYKNQQRQNLHKSYFRYIKQYFSRNDKNNFIKKYYVLVSKQSVFGKSFTSFSLFITRGLRKLPC